MEQQAAEGTRATAERPFEGGEAAMAGGRTALGERLAGASASLAERFVREQTRWLARGLWRSPLLEGVAQSLLVELGAELAGEADPTGPWRRCSGVLRVSSARGPDALVREVGCLRRLVRALLAEDDPVDLDVAAFCEEALDVALAGALAELATREGEDVRRPAFGGVVVELYEAVVPEETRPGRGAPRVSP